MLNLKRFTSPHLYLLSKNWYRILISSTLGGSALGTIFLSLKKSAGTSLFSIEAPVGVMRYLVCTSLREPWEDMNLGLQKVPIFLLIDWRLSATNKHISDNQSIKNKNNTLQIRKDGKTHKLNWKNLPINSVLSSSLAPLKFCMVQLAMS